MATTEQARANVIEALRQAAASSPDAAREIRRLLDDAGLGRAVCAGDVNGAARRLVDIITGGRVPTDRKILDTTLYDTDFLGTSGVQNRNFFTSLAYQAGPLQGQDKGVATNMEAEGQLPRPKRHEATGILWEILPDPVTGELPSLAELLVIRASAYWVLFRGTQPVRKLKFGLSSGPGVAVVANAASNLQAAQLGAASAFDHLRFGEHKFINESEEPFRVQMASSAIWQTANPLCIRVGLTGIEETTTG